MPGIEINCDVEGAEIHVLGYYMDYEAAWFQDFCRALRAERLAQRMLGHQCRQFSDEVNRMLGCRAERRELFDGRQSAVVQHHGRRLQGFAVQPAQRGPAPQFLGSPQGGDGLHAVPAGGPCPGQLPLEAVQVELVRADLDAVVGALGEQEPLGRFEQLPQVRDAAVVGVPHPEFGEQVRAVVVPRDPAAAGPALEAELVAHCRAHLAGPKLPRSMEFVAELPRSEAGKLLRRILKERYLSPA